MKVAVLGASPNPERYSNRAIKMLREFRHDVVPVNPGHKRIEGLETVADLKSIVPGTIDTLTVYVQPAHSDKMADEIIRLRPRRVIFNPGAENPPLLNQLSLAGIETVEQCTLVMLRAGNF